MAKYVYFFGGSKADGRGRHEEPARRQGRQPRRDVPTSACPCPAGFTITTEVCTYYYAHDKQYPPELKAEVEAAMKQDRGGHGRQVRRSEEPAARLLPLRRPRLHARHDGHRAQHRPQRSDPARPDREDRQRALRLGQLPPLRADVRRRRPRPQAADEDRDRPVRAHHGRAQAREEASSSTPS